MPSSVCGSSHGTQLGEAVYAPQIVSHTEAASLDSDEHESFKV
jgi:hypothetical protein